MNKQPYYVGVWKLILKSSSEVCESFVFFPAVDEHSILQPEKTFLTRAIK